MPSLIDSATASLWCERLTAEVPWRSQRRRMYDRDVDVPRVISAYTLDSNDLPEPVQEAARRVSAACGNVAFTDVGLNLYRDGNDSVAPHNDHLYEIVAGFPIGLLSLGATRRMTIRSKQRPRRAYDLDLESGSLLVMSYATQKTYDHGIPKMRRPAAPRISLAFRVRPR